MQIGEFEYVNCNLCGSNNYVIWQASIIESQPQIIKVKCKRCGLIYANPRPTKISLRKYYEQYYKKGYSHEVYLLKENQKVLFDRNKRQLLRIMKYKNIGRFLDVGCGIGHMLVPAKKAGFEVYGVDLSKTAIKYAKEKFKFNNVTQGDIFDTNYKNSFFDIVYSWHTIEHVLNPLGWLKEIDRILKEDGLLNLGTINHACLTYRIRRLLDFIQFRIPTIYDGNEHTYGFTVQTLKRILKMAGFKVVKARSYSEKFSLPIWSVDNLKNHSVLIQRKGSKNPLSILRKWLRRPFWNLIPWLENLLSMGEKMDVYARKIK